MALIKTPDEIQKMKNVCAITSLILKKLIRDTRIGDTGLDINNRAVKLFNELGVDTLFYGYHGFPALLCISINDSVIHGIPNGEPFNDGDIIKYDIGARLDGYCSDMARTFILGHPRSNYQAELVTHTRKAIDNAISRVRDGVTLKNIAEEIETYAANHQLGNVGQFHGHGIGAELHEFPAIHNCSRNVQENIILKEGMIFTIEPMFTLGSSNIIKDNNWTVRTVDGSMAAHFEEVILVSKNKNGHEVLTK